MLGGRRKQPLVVLAAAKRLLGPIIQLLWAPFFLFAVAAPTTADQRQQHYDRPKLASSRRGVTGAALYRAREREREVVEVDKQRAGERAASVWKLND